MEHIIIDFDNTFGVPNCDVDDGLALLYLLGHGNVHIVGITTTYGNSDLDTVFDNTQRMLKDLKRDDIPLIRGIASRNQHNSNAGSFLVQKINEYHGSLKILATGSLTNLRAACMLDKECFKKTAEVVLMGGLTSDLYVNGLPMKELNFSCDPLAALDVLTKGANVSVLTGNHCLDAYFSHDEYKKRLTQPPSKIGSYIYEHTRYWFDYMKLHYDHKGFCNWDVAAAVYLLHKEYFTEQLYEFKADPEDLKEGYLRQKTQNPHSVNLPAIFDLPGFTEEVYQSWLNVTY